MIYLQDYCNELSQIKDKLEIIGKNGCLAFVCLWLMGLDEENPNNIKLIAREMGKSLEEDCTVKWHEFFKNISGRKIAVEFRDISSLHELRDVKGKCAVRYDFNNRSHWVGVENCQVVYNPIEFSLCVTQGKPTRARIIYFE